MTKVYFQESDLTIQIGLEEDNTWLYEVDLEKCTDSAQTLDYILQVAGKTWCTPQILFDLIKELEKACKSRHGGDAQKIFCSFGENQEVTWK